jgi:lipopolysaccharide transport system permease protein
MALAIWLNVLTARYRDLNQFVPTVIGFMIWVTPVFYPVSLIPPRFSFFLYLNPLVGDIQGCRWSVLGDTFPSLWFLPSFIFSLIMLITGFMIFIRTEDSLVDYI